MVMVVMVIMVTVVIVVTVMSTMVFAYIDINVCSAKTETDG
jgi:hypothetical protein